MTKNLIPWKRNKHVMPVHHETDNPFLALHQSMNDLFEDFFGDFEGAFRTPGGRMIRSEFGALPRVDVAESNDEVVVTADLPGLTEKDVEVTLDGDLLTIKGSRKDEREETKKDYRVMERSYGEFYRTIEVPAGVDREKAKATFKNGVLKLNMPKLPEAKEQKKKIEITAS